MKKILRFLLRIFLGILGFLILYAICSFVFSWITVKAETGQAPDVTVYLKTNGVHADIVVPVKNEFRDWTPDVPYADTRAGDSTLGYLAFGWGDKAFYLDTPTWADLKFSTAFRAAFALSTTAMHTTYYDTLVVDKSCIRFTMGAAQYRRLVDYLDKGFERDSLGRTIVIPTEARYGNNDAFYEGVGTYSLFRTCNTWAN
ncbi:MAG: TIGR02117 family protein, partial [Sphingobacteriales bacterium]